MSREVCSKCGLPKDLCICREIAKEQQVVKVLTTRRRFGKIITVVKGINEKEVDLKGLSKELKARCACGGTVKKGCVELQGDQKKFVEGTLREMGYTLEG
ncbi:MAG TPA: stress response translation initiation inhibitor YciH, partial [Methanomicrobia archaeon]|nr:stress response translation initiation inhibitor YciH [Methanomicrobia archaeon]